MEAMNQLLTVGARFEMCECPYEVCGIYQDHLRISPVNGGNIKHLKLAALPSLIEQGEIRITYVPGATVDADGKQLLSGLTDRQIGSHNYRWRWSEEIIRRHPKNPCSQRAIAESIDEIAGALGDKNPPGKSTLARWTGKYLKALRRSEVFLPKARPSRSPHFRLDPKVVEYIEQAIKKVYLTPQRNPLSKVESDVQVSIANHNVDATIRLSMPSKETIRRIMQRIDRFERDLRRHGRAYAHRKHRAAGKAFYASEPLELCMADGQYMDLIVVEEPHDDGRIQQAIGRPYLTLIIDVRTRCVLSAFVSLAPFSGATLLAAMKTAITEHPEQPRGVMTTLVVDNGADFRDNGFAGLCARLNINLEPCPPYSPNSKAIAERFFRTLNEGLIHRLPGATFSNPADRGDYDSQKYARATLSELQQLVDVWVQDDYHHRVHSALGRAPIDVWKEAVEASSPLLTLSQDDADILARTVVNRTVSNGRVQCHGLLYQSPTLKTHEITERALGHQPVVSVRINELDLSVVYVETGQGPSKRFQATSTQPHYTNGLSLFEHNRLRAILRATERQDRLSRIRDDEAAELRVKFRSQLGHANDPVAYRHLVALGDELAALRDPERQTDEKTKSPPTKLKSRPGAPATRTSKARKRDAQKAPSVKSSDQSPAKDTQSPSPSRSSKKPGKPATAMAIPTGVTDSAEAEPAPRLNTRQILQQLSIKRKLR